MVLSLWDPPMAIGSIYGMDENPDFIPYDGKSSLKDTGCRRNGLNV